MRFVRTFLAATGLLLAPVLVEATTVTYTDISAFTAATQGLATISFEGLAPPDLFAFFNSPPGLTTSNVNFQSINSNSLFVIDPDFGPGFESSSGQYLNNNSFDPGTGIVATLPVGVTAVGTDISGLALPQLSFTAIVTTASGSESVAFTVPTQPTLSFVGFVSDAAITSVRFISVGQGAAPAVTLDNFRFGTAAIPEPATLILFGTGLAAARMRRSRRKR